MHTRRFTRLTNAFSKKVENHAHSVAVFALYYNFVRIHKTLRTTPAMAALIFLLLNLGASIFKPKSRLEAENAALRQQLIVLQRKVRGRVQFTNSDRLFFIQLNRWFPSVLKAITIVRPG